MPRGITGGGFNPSIPSVLFLGAEDNQTAAATAATAAQNRSHSIPTAAADTPVYAADEERGGSTKLSNMIAGADDDTDDDGAFTGRAQHGNDRSNRESPIRLEQHDAVNEQGAGIPIAELTHSNLQAVNRSSATHSSEAHTNRSINRSSANDRSNEHYESNNDDHIFASRNAI